MELSALENIYKGKKVFITGHTGFKGSWMLQWLYLLGAQIKGYALEPDYEDNLYNLINGDKLCESVIADIRDKAKLEQAVLDFQPHFIFHLAAQPLVRLSYQIPSETFEVNAIGTAYLLDAVQKLDQPCTIVLITTDKVYENKEWVYPYRETDALGGFDPYSASKACTELVINSYTQSFFNIAYFNEHKKALATARAGNVIGGGDWAKDRIVPDLVKALQNKSTVQVRNPEAVRPWQHVLEPIGGYLLLGAQLANNPASFSGAWNFGPFAEDNKRVEDLVIKAIDVWKEGKYEKPDIKNKLHEAGLLKLDISKAVNLLDWKPKYNSDTAITKTIEWYKTFFEDRILIKDFTLAQIKSFISE